MAEAGTLLGETVVGLAVGAVVAVVAGLALRSLWPVCSSSSPTWGNGGLYWLGSHADPRDRPPVRSSTRAWCRPTASRPVTSAPPSRSTAAPRSCSRSGCGAAAAGRRRRVLVVLLACLPLFVAVSRLYEGAHHLTDVGTSLVYGTLWLAVARRAGPAAGRATEPAVPRSARGDETRQYRTGDREVVLDLTRDCAAFVADRGDGLLQLFVPHATAGIAIIETGAGSDDDLLSALGDLLPADDRWRHAHGSRGHGRSHVMPAIVPPHATVPGARRPARARHLAEHLPGRPQRRQRRADRAVQLPGAG